MFFTIIKFILKLILVPYKLSGGKIEFSYLVELFFILSGFFMFSYIKKIEDGMNFKDFFVPKYFRFLAPMVLSCIAFTIFNVAYESLYAEQFFDRTVTLWGLIQSSLGFITGWGLEPSKTNGVIWYIGGLLICFIIFYIIVFFCKKCKAAPYWMFAFMILAAFFVKTNQINILFFNSGTVRGISSFFWGLILAKFLYNKKISNKTALFSALLLVLSVTAVVLWKGTYAKYNASYLYTFFIFTFLIILMLSEPVKKIFKHKVWGTISAISFDVYLWHFPILLLIIDLNKVLNLQIDYSNRINLLILALCSFAIGTLSYYFVEKPFTKWSVARLRKNYELKN